MQYVHLPQDDFCVYTSMHTYSMCRIHVGYTLYMYMYILCMYTCIEALLKTTEPIFGLIVYLFDFYPLIINNSCGCVRIYL